MRTSVIGITAACVLLFAASAFASEEMAGQYDCMGCHSIEANESLPKKYAPYFKDIAKKYKEKYKDDNDKALALIEQSILRGSHNKWDRPVDMKSRAENGKTIDAAHAKEMAQWIMTLAE
ncbi:MAG: c-type cytochrome [Candidatus Electrothrix sp. Rat3]|nr:c-type cytochrome [Candidatus Electrothrix rattekaaiensis]